MSLAGWMRQIEWRYYCHFMYASFINLGEVLTIDWTIKGMFRGILRDDEAVKHLFSQADILKAGIIPYDSNYRDRADLIVEYSFDTTSVTSLSSFALWNMATDIELSDVWKVCEFEHDVVYNDITDTRNNDHDDFITEPYDFHLKKYARNYTAPQAHVVVDLSATDEQIKNDFNQWLTHYRQAIDIKAQKKLFTQADFDYWIQYSAIPYLDLALIAKIEGKKITQNQLAQLIFPSEYDVDIVGRLRQVTKPEAERLIKNKIHKTLSTQLVSEKIGMKNA